MEARLEVQIAHEPGGDEVLLDKVVVEAGTAVAAEVAGREVALVAADEALPLRDLEIASVDEDAGQTRTRPALASGAVADTHALGVSHLVLHSATQTGAFQRLGHRRAS